MLTTRKLLLTLYAVAALGLSSAVSAGKPCETCRYDARVVSIHDGDTFRINWPGLPAELNPVSIRVRGIDTPELRGKCPSEKALAYRAKALTLSYLNRSAGYITLGNLGWDKYGGRIDADAYLGPQKQSLARLLISSGLARPYAGNEKRRSWC